MQQIRRVNQRYSDQMHREREQLQRRLYHEAFHAYTQEFFFVSAAGSGSDDSSGRQPVMPRWLAEGLAQVFETAQFDTEDLLRIDAPDADRLALLQEDLASAAPLPLRHLVVADQASFLVPHDASGRTSQRHYLYAWAVAYYLAFEHPGFSSERIREYASSADPSTVSAFEQLVGMPVDAFEARWRDRMREIHAD